MIQQIFDFIKSLSDKSFRALATLAIVALGFYSYRLDSKLSDIVKSSNSIEALARLDERVKALEHRQDFFYGKPTMPEAMAYKDVPKS